MGLQTRDCASKNSTPKPTLANSCATNSSSTISPISSSSDLSKAPRRRRSCTRLRTVAAKPSSSPPLIDSTLSVTSLATSATRRFGTSFTARPRSSFTDPIRRAPILFGSEHTHPQLSCGWNATTCCSPSRQPPNLPRRKECRLFVHRNRCVRVIERGPPYNERRRVEHTVRVLLLQFHQQFMLPRRLLLHQVQPKERKRQSFHVQPVLRNLCRSPPHHPFRQLELKENRNASFFDFHVEP